MPTIGVTHLVSKATWALMKARFRDILLGSWLEYLCYRAENDWEPVIRKTIASDGGCSIVSARKSCVLVGIEVIYDEEVFQILLRIQETVGLLTNLKRSMY